MTDTTIHEIHLRPGMELPKALRDIPLTARKSLASLSRLRAGSLRATLPDGHKIFIEGAQPGPNAELHLYNWRLARRAFVDGTVGVAESWIDGDWDSPDVVCFLRLFVANSETMSEVATTSGKLSHAIQRFRHWLNDNTPKGSRRNIAAHYDLGNSFYRLWLDPSMTYSSALWSAGSETLEQAQTAKYNALLDDMGAQSGEHILEIGCGWGGFAETAARRGCHVTGLTISQQQHDHAEARLATAGLSDKAKIAFRDYRHEIGQYDHIASIEMFEAVGERWWPTYFETLNRTLKPGGTAGLQIITIAEHAFEDYRRYPDFIQRYVFPGGMLPTPTHLRDLAATVGLTIENERRFPQDYARTLALWRERFEEVWPKIRALGFDERFRKVWLFYLYYCEAGFREENIDVRQIILRKPV
ncbi:cyclopropane-fatty-acyl-phospholipid synthase family protein [Notoacmeibacter sp. MSK16QG-6]|uniref:SAM-dependent methyltransferase n=1 Tax=Notoacmeibacter sp. MSK16QG-6 TaxID=2957982 RepID=UPI00209D563C|nr:cyclopropane-fatty-acyl-phospholipid synthase family protein [Notoacmeibacter sp. MSK16QG-6]MCP1199409.1 cyclopropane-fatty-acyl-phospholipid synthase family protein [Notoacmeibacter sp. MSK16QG-6]